jgi:hypothetical protein
MDICVFSVFVLSCVGSVLEKGVMYPIENQIKNDSGSAKITQQAKYLYGFKQRRPSDIT